MAGQLLRSGTSPSLNYGEAQGGESRKDFIHKIKIVLKELRESYVSLKIIKRARLHDSEEKINIGLKENNELISIFVKSAETAQKNGDKRVPGIVLVRAGLRSVVRQESLMAELREAMTEQIVGERKKAGQEGLWRLGLATIVAFIGAWLLVWLVVPRATEWKDWPVVKTDAFGGATFELATMWSDSRLFYRLQMDGDPAAMVAIASAVDYGADVTFFLTFNDSQGFMILERHISLREMSGTVGGDGVRTGLSWADDEYQSADTYRDVAAWNLQWGFTVRHPPLQFAKVHENQ